AAAAGGTAVCRISPRPRPARDSAAGRLAATRVGPALHPAGRDRGDAGAAGVGTAPAAAGDRVMTQPLTLVCPAGTPAALEAALEAGADTVYCGFRDATNARNFPGLNFSRAEMKAGITTAHAAG